MDTGWKKFLEHEFRQVHTHWWLAAQRWMRKEQPTRIIAKQQNPQTDRVPQPPKVDPSSLRWAQDVKSGKSNYYPEEQEGVVKMADEILEQARKAGQICESDESYGSAAD